MILKLKKYGLNSRIRGLLIGLLIIVFFSLANCKSSEPLVVTITELSACKGWNVSGEPIGISSTFPPDAEQIFACGRLEANILPIVISISWYYEGKLLSTHVVEDVSEYFYASIEPTENVFSKGNYLIEVFVGKTLMSSTDFQVK